MTELYDARQLRARLHAMRRSAATCALVMILAACGGGSKFVATSTTTTTVFVPTTEPATVPAPVATSDPSVGSLCATAVGDMLGYIRSPDNPERNLHFSSVLSLPDTNPLTKLIHETLIDCSSRIEWLTAVVDQGVANRTAFDGLFQSECRLENLLNRSIGNLPSAADALTPGAPHVFDPNAHPIPVACQQP